MTDAYQTERWRTPIAYNLHLVSKRDCHTNGKGFGFPELKASHSIPTELIPFNQAKDAKDPHDKAVHFFIDDYQFERVWRSPERYFDILGRFESVFTPDFSLYRDMPLPMQQWNVYRSRTIGVILQRHGIDVIPTLQWSTKDSYPFSFDGLPHDSTVAVSTRGVHGDRRALRLFTDGLNEAIRRLSPRTIIMYGPEIRTPALKDRDVRVFEAYSIH